MSLVVGDILAVLFSRADPDTFHWAICVPINDENAAKYHAKGSAGHWWFEKNPIPLHNLINEKPGTVSAAIKIGSLDPLHISTDVFQSILEPIPMEVPEIDRQQEEKFTCRVWFREAVRRLHTKQVIDCLDVDSLERECFSYALTNQAAYPSYKGYQYYVSQCSV